MSEMKGLSSELSRALGDVLSRLVRGPDGLHRASAESLESQMTTIRRSVDAKLSAELTAWNALAPAIHRLPDEILTLIWADLPFDDFACASRVCRKWRTVAEAAPRLWTYLEIIDTAHYSKCKCGYCSPGVDNFDYIQRVLPLSKALPLSLLFLVPAAMAATDYYQWDTLYAFLRPHVHRFTELEIVADDHTVPDGILGNFSQFPALRCLSVARNRDDGPSEYSEIYFRVEDWFKPGTGKGSAEHRFPALERLELHSDCIVGTRAVCPTLRRLSCSIRRLDEVQGMLLSAARLEHLHLELRESFQSAEYADSDAELRRNIDRIPHVRISNIDFFSVDRTFLLFARSRRRRLILDHSARLATVTVRPQILSDNMQGAVDLRASKVRGGRDSEVELAFADRAGHSVLLRYTASPSIPGRFTRADRRMRGIDWTQVPALDSLVTLTVNAVVWPAVMPEFPRAPNLETLTVRIQTAEDLDELVQTGVDASFAPNASITISSSIRIPVSSKALELAKEALGVQNIQLKGVFVQDPS